MLMLGLLIVGPALLGIEPAASPPEAWDSYAEALAQVGRDANAQVRLALWCEAHGLQAERLKHLSLAVLKDPTHPLARGLLGLVLYRGRWRHPEDVGAALQDDAARRALLAEYEQKRDKLPEKAEAHWKLALWCEANGLKAESVAHLWSVVRLDPSREAAWKHLGYKKQPNGRWVTEAQLAREKEEAEIQKKADRYWRPWLEKWRGWLSGKDAAKQAEAIKGLSEVTDPRAVPMVWSVFATGDESLQKMAVQVLGQVDAAGASRALAMLAVLSKSAEVRRTATETLARRDVREFAGLLIGFLRDPIKYEVRPVGGPGSPGEIFIQGKTTHLKRRYSPPPVPDLPALPGAQTGYDANGLPVLSFNEGLYETGFFPVSGVAMGAAPPTPAQLQHFHSMMAQHGLGAQATLIEKMVPSQPSLTNLLTSPSPFLQIIGLSAMYTPLRPTTRFNFELQRQFVVPIGQMAVEAQKTAVAAQQQLQNDVATIDRYNEPIIQSNERVLPILRLVSGQDLGNDREAWTKWLVDQIGYNAMFQKASDTNTIIEDVPLSYQPQPVPIGEVDTVVGFRRMSCFAAGTPVHILSGLRPIESLRVGDEVLTQDLETGALGYRPVLVVHRNPPAETFRISLGGETITSSEFHRFWRAGKGWVMARDLKTGDTLRTLGGLSKVEAIETGSVQPVFNLDVAEDADFFVGSRGALVHDNTLPDLRLSPFDAEQGPATASRH